MNEVQKKAVIGVVCGGLGLGACGVANMGSDVNLDILAEGQTFETVVKASTKPKVVYKALIYKEVKVASHTVKVKNESNLDAKEMKRLLAYYGNVTVNTKDGSWINTVYLPTPAPENRTVTLNVNSTWGVKVKATGLDKKHGKGSKVVYIHTKGQWKLK